MTRIRRLSCGLVLFLVLLMAVPAPARDSHDGETRVTVTIAFCGAIGGFFFFIAFRSGLLPPGSSPPPQGAALFDHGPEGWRVYWPLPVMVQVGDQPAAPVVPVLQVRF
jgi:hypothetical protein